jgi:hypothetical protein
MDYTNAEPFVISAFTDVLSNFKEDCTIRFGEELGDVLHEIVFEMCHPVLSKRGKPGIKNEILRLQLDRYVSKLAWVVSKAKIIGIR